MEQIENKAELNHTYIIEGVGCDAPYISIGYVKDYAEGEIVWTRDLRQAMRTQNKELMHNVAIRMREYHKEGKVDVSAWFFEIDNENKVAKHRTFEKDLL